MNPVDETAHFEALFRHFHPRLVRFLSAMLVGTGIDPEDVAQESMVKAWRYRDRYDQQYRFSTWIYTIARRTATDHLKQRSNHAIDVADSYVVHAAENKDDIEQQEQNQNLWKVVEQHLNADQYAATWLRYGEGLSVRELSRVMNKSQVSARVLLHRARKALAPVLACYKLDSSSTGASES